MRDDAGDGRPIRALAHLSMPLPLSAATPTYGLQRADARLGYGLYGRVPCLNAVACLEDWTYSRLGWGSSGSKIEGRLLAFCCGLFSSRMQLLPTTNTLLLQQ
jgi:hypothetical protein